MNSRVIALQNRRFRICWGPREHGLLEAGSDHELGGGRERRWVSYVIPVPVTMNTVLLLALGHCPF